MSDSRGSYWPSPPCTRRSRRSAASRPTRRCPSRRPSCSHIANNHPLPDANKRAAFLLTARFLDANGLTWRAPDVDIDAGMVESIAVGEAAHDEIVDWIRERTRKEGDEPRGIS